MKSTIGFGLILSAAITAAPLAQAQDSTAKGQKKKARTTFFDTSTPLEISIAVNLKQLQGDKGDSVPWRNATLTTGGSEGNARTIPMKMRTRGKWRLKKCEYPPIRLNFAGNAVKGTEFEGLDKPKLVSFCRDNDLHEQYVLQEFQLYRVYQQLSPYSHRVRLVRLSYVDSATGKLRAKRLAFIVEEPQALAERLNAKVIEEKGARADDMEDSVVAVFSLFEYMIGNTDFSISSLHNAVLLGLPAGMPVPVPYDFDFSGAVNTTYSTPDPKLRLDGVRMRRYRGYCVPPVHIEAAVAQFNAVKPEIFALYEDPISKMLAPRLKNSVLEYFTEFYKTINNRGELKSQLIEACLPRDKSDAPNR